MSRLCKNCGKEITDEERVCPNCGADGQKAERIVAEWRGKWHYEYGDEPVAPLKTPEPPKPILPSRTVEIERERSAPSTAKTGGINGRRALFFLSFIGLMLDFFWGLGFLVCLPTAIVASVELVKLYRKEGKYSTQLVWACVIGYLGAVLGLAFFILIV